MKKKLYYLFVCFIMIGFFGCKDAGGDPEEADVNQITLTYNDQTITKDITASNTLAEFTSDAFSITFADPLIRIEAEYMSAYGFLVEFDSSDAEGGIEEEAVGGIYYYSNDSVTFYYSGTGFFATNPDWTPIPTTITVEFNINPELFN